MNITVKATKILKTGANDYGNWKLVKVTTDEDVEYTTFIKDEDDNITPGDVLAIDNLSQDDKERWSFKKYEIVGAAKAKTKQPPAKTTPAIDPTRVSIERQVAAKLVFEFFRDDDIGEMLADAELVYQWISMTGDTPQPTSKPPERVSSPTPTVTKVNPQPEQETHPETRQPVLTEPYGEQIDKVVGGRDLSLLKTTTDVMRAITGETNGSLQPTDQLNLLREVDPAFKWTGYKGTMPDLYQKILLLAEGEVKE